MVAEVVSNLPNAPPETDEENPAGNHIMLTCQNANVLLAHMQQDSIIVQEGETVSAGQALGQVGNSGNTTEPHLHIHAVRADHTDIADGQGIPILFNGDFPTRNEVYVR